MTAGPPDRVLTVATYNIHSAVGTDGRFAPQRIAAVLTEIGADIVALQEVPLGDDARPDVLGPLLEATGYHGAAGATIDEGAARRYGNAVLSRFPIGSIDCIDLSFGAREPRGALDAQLLVDGDALRVVATHLGLQPTERRTQVRQLLEAVGRDPDPVVLMGDLNEWFVWGRPLRWLAARFEAAAAPATFPSRRPVFALDRIWMSPPGRLLTAMAHRSALARIASDHLPLVARIAMDDTGGRASRGEVRRRAASPR